MANGKVVIGFSNPFVALYSATGTTVTYSSGMPLARGVSVSTSVDVSTTDDFYADDASAESGPSTFNGGTVQITADSPLIAAEKMVMGLDEAGTDGFTDYKSSTVIPFVGLGFVVKYMSGGQTLYTPFVYPKVDFQPFDVAAETQGASIDWQTMDMTANIHFDDSADKKWKRVGTDYTTEVEAVTALKKALGVETA